MPVLEQSSEQCWSTYIHTGELVVLEGPAAENKLDLAMDVPGEVWGVAVTDDIGVMGSDLCCWCSFK